MLITLIRYGIPALLILLVAIVISNRESSRRSW